MPPGRYRIDPIVNLAKTQLKDALIAVGRPTTLRHPDRHIHFLSLADQGGGVGVGWRDRPPNY